MENNVILEMKGITKLFPGVKALNNVNLTLHRGEVHALIGENGAGKSTLMKILLGSYQRDGGEIIYKGEPVRFKAPKEALDSGIAMIHQEISLVPLMDISENIWLGREKEFQKFGLLSPRKRLERTKQLLEELEIEMNPKRKVGTLSIAQMQMVEIARATSYNADVIIMDEPTSALTDTEVQKLYHIIRKLSAQGVAIIFISHKLEEIFEVCDYVTVLRDGNYIATKKSSEITKAQLVSMIVGREITDMFPKKIVPIGDTVLKVEGLTRTGVFEDVSFELKRGEILGFCGLMGAGRTEIMRGLFGIDPVDRGSVTIEGKQVHIHSPMEAIQHGLGMVTEDRLRAGAMHNQSIRNNTTLAYFREICNWIGFFDRKRENADFLRVAEQMQVKYASPTHPISSLSGGNQQKVIIARWLLTNPKILILDEPTRGIDVGSKSEIHRIMGDLVERGVSILLVSSEMPELLGVSDRILVVRHGRIVHECQAGQADQEMLISYAFGAADTANDKK